MRMGLPGTAHTLLRFGWSEAATVIPQHRSYFFGPFGPRKLG